MELMVSMIVLTSLMVMFVGLLDQTQRSWQFAQGQISQFREARVAFDIMTKTLSQATLNAYYEQVDKNNDGIPDEYDITSELHFNIFPATQLPIGADKPGQAIFFQAPLGVTGKKEYSTLSNLMCARGYYVAFNSDQRFRPPFINSPIRNRYRLMEYTPPTEWNDIYVDFVEDVPNVGQKEPNQYFQDWFKNSQYLNRYSRPLAENIVAVTFSPREAYEDESRAVRDIAPRYEYNSEWPNSQNAAPSSPAARFKHRLPPLVKVTLIAIDETSAANLIDYGQGNDEFMKSYAAGLFNFADRAELDMQQIIQTFNDENEANNGITIRYKVFSTTVSILGAKWSSPPQQ